jgi:hypothetical protein
MSSADYHACLGVRAYFSDDARPWQSASVIACRCSQTPAGTTASLWRITDGNVYFANVVPGHLQEQGDQLILSLYGPNSRTSMSLSNQMPQRIKVLAASELQAVWKT